MVDEIKFGSELGGERVGDVVLKQFEGQRAATLRQLAVGGGRKLKGGQVEGGNRAKFDTSGACKIAQPNGRARSRLEDVGVGWQPLAHRWVQV